MSSAPRPRCGAPPNGWSTTCSRSTRRAWWRCARRSPPCARHKRRTGKPRATRTTSWWIWCARRWQRWRQAAMARTDAAPRRARARRRKGGAASGHAAIAPMALAAANGEVSRAPRQTVLVLQGGGALGAYQVGVYQALHEHGIEPDWVIGTSIGAINGALIAGNRPEQRLERLHAFWDRVEQSSPTDGLRVRPLWGNWLSTLNTVSRGIPNFFTPN